MRLLDVSIGGSVMTALADDVRSLLELRSTRDKIAVALDPRLRPTEDVLAVVRKLCEDGYLVWFDRAQIAHIRERETMLPVMMDIYLLTPKGVALCEEHGIKQQ